MELAHIIKKRERQEKRFLPRLPFTSLTFREKGGQKRKTFEVRDISQNGMRLTLREGEHFYQLGLPLVGSIRSKYQTLQVKGIVRWVNESNIGVEFTENAKLKKTLREFLGSRNLAKGIRNLCDLKQDFPSGLRYWTRSDTGFEVFVWCHHNGGIFGFQMLFAGNIVEWKEHLGVRTGDLTYLRSRVGPLYEEEFLFDFEYPFDKTKILFAEELINLLTEQHLPEDTLIFIKSKLSPQKLVF